MFTKEFWFSDTGVLVRAIRTFAQTAIAAIGVGTTNMFSADLKNVLALSGSAAVLSILMSLDRSADVKTVEAKTPGVYITELTPEPVSVPTVYAAGCGTDLR